METKQQLLKVELPQEVNELALKVSHDKQEEIKTVLTQIFTGTADWEAQVDAIEVKDINDSMSISLADTARKNAKNARISAEKIFDAKRYEVQNLKAEYDLEDKLWLKAKQVAQIKFKAIEEKAKWKSEFVKRYEAEQLELKIQKRMVQVSKFAEINRVEFENMSDAAFESFISGLQAQKDAEIAEAKKIEAERIEKEKEAKRIEAERKAELERLRKENEAKEVQIAKEREEAEKARLKAEKEQKEKLDKERKAKEKVEAELKAQKDAELAKEAEAEKARLKAEKEAAKLAKAPIKKQLNEWVNSFDIPLFTTENEVAKSINQKFEAFKKWSLEQVENI